MYILWVFVAVCGLYVHRKYTQPPTGKVYRCTTVYTPRKWCTQIIACITPVRNTYTLYCNTFTLQCNCILRDYNSVTIQYTLLRNYTLLNPALHVGNDTPVRVVPFLACSLSTYDMHTTKKQNDVSTNIVCYYS